MKFNVGDKVRLKREYPNAGLPTGAEGKIVEVNELSLTYDVHFIQHSPPSHQILERDLELVESASFTASHKPSSTAKKAKKRSSTKPKAKKSTAPKAKKTGSKKAGAKKSRAKKSAVKKAGKRKKP